MERCELNGAPEHSLVIISEGNNGAKGRPWLSQASVNEK